VPIDKILLNMALNTIALFTKILTIILSVKIVLTLRVKLPCPKCKILIVREILVLSFIISEKNRKKDGRCIIYIYKLYLESAWLKQHTT
jgi:hypothetical protein